MSSIYSSQAVLGNAIGPVSGQYAPIPHLNPLKITDDELYFGGTASLNLYLGYVTSDQIISFSFYVNIIETTSGDIVSETYFGGGGGISTVVSVSTIYNIAPKAQPIFVAQWKVAGSTGATVRPPVTISFSAIVFESEGT